MRELSSVINNFDEREIELWFKANNIIDEYCELFEDFIVALYFIIDSTYLGADPETNSVTNISLNKEDIKNHYNWCWKKNIDNFKKENILFEEEGEHKEYFRDFFHETYYFQEMKEIKKSIPVFFTELFMEKKTDSQINLQMLTEIYKYLYKSLLKPNKSNL